MLSAMSSRYLCVGTFLIQTFSVPLHSNMIHTKKIAMIGPRVALIPVPPIFDGLFDRNVSLFDGILIIISVITACYLDWGVPQ